SASEPTQTTPHHYAPARSSPTSPTDHQATDDGTPTTPATSDQPRPRPEPSHPEPTSTAPTTTPSAGSAPPGPRSTQYRPTTPGKIATASCRERTSIQHDAPAATTTTPPAYHQPTATPTPTTQTTAYPPQPA